MMDTCVLIPDDFSLVLTLHPNPLNILEMNVALWSNRTLSVGTKFWPDQGSVRLDKLEIYSHLKDDDVRNEFGSEDSIQTVDGKEVRHCNWVRFLKTSSDIDKVNMVGTKVKGEVEFHTVKTILPNEEIVAYLQKADDNLPLPQTADEHMEDRVTMDLKKVKRELDISSMSPVPFPGSRDLLTSPPSRDDDCKSSVSDGSHSSSDETSSPNSTGTPETERYSDPGLSPYYMSSYPQQMSPLNLTSPRTPSKASHTSDMSSIFTSPMTSTTTNSHSPMTSSSELSPPIMSRIDFTPSPPGTRIRPKRNRERTWLPCDVCGKKFDRPSLLKRHMRTHTGEKPHACDVCGKAFSTSSSLNTHRRIHSGEKPHQCGVCGKRFTASSNLYYHRMTHNKEKPHKCQLCSKSFPTPGDLRSHMYVHNGSWPYRCDICNRGFSKQTNMKNHMLLHTGDKPHECPKCQKKFALYCNLKTHLKTHEDDNQGSCVTCGRTFLRKQDASSDECIDCIRAASPDSTQLSKRPVSDFSISKLTNSDDKDDDEYISPKSRNTFDPRFHPFYNPLMLMTPPSTSNYLSREHQPVSFMPVLGMTSFSEQKGHHQSRPVHMFNPNLTLAEIAYQSQMAQYRQEWSGLMAK